MFKLLIAEDVKLVRETLARSIDWKRLGIELVGLAKNGEEALEWLSGETPDLLLTDIGMPKGNGIELIEAFRSHKPDIRCIILSGLNEFEFARQAIKLQVLEYIMKPIDPEEIERVFVKIVAELSKERDERRGREILEQRLKDHMPNLADTLPAVEWSGSLKKKKLVEQAIQAIRANYVSKELTLSDVAQEVGLSEKYVNALVKEVTGLTISHWIVKLRMEEAQRLLKDPTFRIYEICDRIGYSDQDHFREMFKKQFGLTPTDYRNNYL
ncbi:response regulator transcription factor [Paenibacillus chibensis]|uniref:response regulator transcription factor n=1 Tax=Paenibacillus chibensis TaxID=59846 RepID=UPI0013E2FF74|nr:response regulator [Paenibacillus chibensis]MEC0372296.1 response regulator [Paenibacillus chibensis]